MLSIKVIFINSKFKPLSGRVNMRMQCVVLSTWKYIKYLYAPYSVQWITGKYLHFFNKEHRKSLLGTVPDVYTVPSTTLWNFI